MDRTRIGIVGVLGSLTNGAWTFINTAVSAINFPRDSADAGNVIMRQLIAAPHLLPITLTVFFMAITLWAFWPRKSTQTENADGRRVEDIGAANGPHISISGVLGETRVIENEAPEERQFLSVQNVGMLNVSGNRISRRNRDGQGNN